MEHTAHINDSARASLDMVILRTLSLRDLRGYGIVQVIQQSSGNEFLIEEGSLYPALQRLELNGWIKGTWDVTSNYRPARIYKITTTGRKQLDEDAQIADWKGVKSCLLYGCVATGVAFGQQPPHDLPSGGIPVDVCIEPAHELLIPVNQAKPLVSAIFSPIGVNLTWHARLTDCDQSARTAFKVRWARRAPHTSSAGALAAARPFGTSDTSITMYEVPLQRFLQQYANAPEVVLAYVVSHELAHVMQRLEYHSASGILKARWSYGECYRMLDRALTFTAADVELIRAGLESNKSKIPSQKAAPQN
jgi:PadR family transcriptional regulator PadR